MFLGSITQKPLGPCAESRDQRPIESLPPFSSKAEIRDHKGKSGLSRPLISSVISNPPSKRKTSFTRVRLRSKMVEQIYRGSNDDLRYACFSFIVRNSDGERILGESKLRDVKSLSPVGIMSTCSLFAVYKMGMSFSSRIFKPLPGMKSGV